MKKIILFFAFCMSLLVSSSSFAFQTSVFAVNPYGTADLNIQGKNICILPGYKLRMSPDIIGQNGQRYRYPASHFIWQANYINGFWERWDARYGTPGFGPFSYAPPRDTVYFSAHPYAMGPMVRIDLVYPNTMMASFLVVDPLHMNNQWDCEWLADIYYVKVGQGENPKDPVDPPSPPPKVEECMGKCESGKYCSDGCPYLGDCEFIPAQPQPYWKVRACK